MGCGAGEVGLNKLLSPSWPPLKTSTGRPKRQGATDGGEVTGLGGDAGGERYGGGKGGGGCDDGGGCPAAAATRTMTRSVGAKLMVRCQTVMNAATATRGTQREAGSEGQAAADERWRFMHALERAAERAQFPDNREGVNTGKAHIYLLPSYNEMALAPPHGRSSRRLQVLAHFSVDVRCADSALSTPG